LAAQLPAFTALIPTDAESRRRILMVLTAKGKTVL
jgi:hypothetical protein